MSRVYKYILEFLLVLISVILAFLFEDIRVQKEQNDEYLKVLKSFHEVIIKDIKNFTKISHPDSVYGNKVKRVEQIISNLETSKEEEAFHSIIIYTFKNAPHVLQFNTNPVYEKLVSDYLSMIKNDTLTRNLNSYVGLLNHLQGMEQRNVEFWSKIEGLVYDNFDVRVHPDDMAMSLIDENIFDQFEYLGPNLTADNLEKFRELRPIFKNYLHEYRRDLMGMIFYSRVALRDFNNISSNIEWEYKEW